MEILSPAWRTDLAMLRLAGSEVEMHPTHVVVRTPEMPTYHWGNFLLLRRVPLRRDLPGVLDLFARSLPGRDHLALGFDDPESGSSVLSALAQARFAVTADLVLTAQRLTPVAPGPHVPRVTRVVSDEDWTQKVALDLACDGGDGSEAHETFASRRAGVQRRLSEAGDAAWFGAWEGSRMLASVGVIGTGGATARIRRAAVHPEARGRGLAAGLVLAAADHAHDAHGAEQLVTVCDPHDPITRLYKKLGLAPAGRQLQAEKHVRPATTTDLLRTPATR
ncbi:GNAT family N-acetyltransferase [Nocardioides bruguierae]|uniref:GNAT family N-acetyltransferase n=1 Tax=Nocardioides bruguierae TaxID=2945102 RepID=A0A9X2IDA8_9ACTN|nr:GNAT family N-acetyltransferase [Nocardioides bruguierae]MCM0618833.1 GNAT family N-acetyltransferase [Nocardioides bruguierae]